MPKNEKIILNQEYRAEMLKERIYATLALLAVLLTIDAHHTSALKAAAIVAGTAFSLWLASIVSSQMSFRIVMQRAKTDKEELELESYRHSPLLLAAVFPVFLMLLAFIHVLSLPLAVNLAIGSSLLLLVGWSLLSARAMKVGRLGTLVLAGVELAIGLAIVALKLSVAH
jgi:hypothetical protein